MTKINTRQARLKILTTIAAQNKKKKHSEIAIREILENYCRVKWLLGRTAVRDYVEIAMELANIV